MMTSEELQEKRLKQLTERSNSDLRRVLSTPEGRRTVWGILERGGVFKISYDPASASQTAFNEGRRDMGLELILRVNACRPDAYTQMALEHSSDEAFHAAELAKAVAEVEKKNGFVS